MQVLIASNHPFLFDRAEYMNTAGDPVSEFSTPILKHMNDDHPETTKAMVEHYITGGVEVRLKFIQPVFFCVLVYWLVCWLVRWLDG